MRVKIITSDNTTILENNINSFIRTQDVVDIKFSTTPKNSFGIDYAALITYK